MKEKEEAIIQRALEQGLLTSANIEECSATVEALAKLGVEKTLLDGLRDYGHLTDSQISDLGGEPPEVQDEPSSPSSPPKTAASIMPSSTPARSTPDVGRTDMTMDLEGTDFDAAEIDAFLEDDFPDGTMDFEPSELDFAVDDEEEEAGSEFIDPSSVPSLHPSSVPSSHPSSGPGPDATIAASYDQNLAGQTLGGCRLEKKLGQGAMGTVFKAEHLALKKTVAVKLLNPSRFYQQKQVDQFFREAQAAAAIEHQNIVGVHDVGEERGLYYIVMQFIEGESLDDRIKREGKLPVDEVVRIILEASRGLSVAHKKNIVHRDIKPGNLMMTKSGEVKIADFGLAFQGDEEGSVTGGVEVMGTPSYMSPEQIDGRNVDHRADLYSLGVTLYYLTTGKKPFVGSTPMEVLLKHMNERLVPPTHLNPELPNALGQVIERLMAKDPANRYPSADDLASDLEEILQGGKPKVVVAMEDFMQRMEEVAKTEFAPTRNRHPLTAAVVSGIVAAFCAILFTVGLPEISASGEASPTQESKRLKRARQEWEIAERFVAENPAELEAIRKMLERISTDFADTPYHINARRLLKDAERDYEVLSREETASLLKEAYGYQREGAYVAAMTTVCEIPEIWLKGRQVAREVGNLKKDILQPKIRAKLGMVYVPGGEFLAGRGKVKENLPSFLIDETEVTNKAYAKFIEETGHTPPSHWRKGTYPEGEDMLPVVGVTYDDAADFAAQYDKRLPTSLEWEKAARSTDGRTYPWGNRYRQTSANAQGIHPGLKSVKQFPQGKSEYGCFNMAGNALEWTVTIDPKSGNRIVRGGGFDSYMTNVSTFAVLPIPSGHQDPAKPVGFRCVRDVR